MGYMHEYRIRVQCDIKTCNRTAAEREELSAHDGGRGKARDRLREEGWTIQRFSLRSEEKIRCPEHRTSELDSKSADT